MYTSLPGGGFHHHGGFLGGYFNFFKGNKDNPADSFSERYEEAPEDKTDYKIKQAEDYYHFDEQDVYIPPPGY